MPLDDSGAELQLTGHLLEHHEGLLVVYSIREAPVLLGLAEQGSSVHGITPTEIDAPPSLTQSVKKRSLGARGQSNILPDAIAT